MMPKQPTTPIAEVIAVHPNRIRVRVLDIHAFRRLGGGDDEKALRVGSYVKVLGDDGGGILAMIDNFTLEPTDDGVGSHVIDASPIGFLDPNGKFTRGATRIGIPPAGVEPATNGSIGEIFADVAPEARFEFAALASADDIKVPVDGDKFFNKHIAVVGSTGSGKSHALASLLQRAVAAKAGGYKGLNNSHIVIFDLHGEYKSAFPGGNVITVDNLRLPYWLMNSEELEELLVDSGENQAYNQISILRRLIRLNKQTHGAGNEVTVDTPCPFDIREVLCALGNLNREYVLSKDPRKIYLHNGDTVPFASDPEKWIQYFTKEFEFEGKQGTSKKGAFPDLDRLLSRMEAKVTDPRLTFLFGGKSQEIGLNQRS